MSKYYFTSQDLISSVKRRANIPDNQNMISPDEILDCANEEMLTEIIPAIMSQHEDYYLVSENVKIEKGITQYDMPYRAVGAKLREVAFIEDDNSIIEMFRISVDDVTNQGNQVNIDSARFYIENEQVVISQSMSEKPGSLKFWYLLRPNSLVLSDRVAKITNIDRSSGTIIVSEMPDHFDISYEFDFIKSKSPHRIISFDTMSTNINSTNKSITFEEEDIPTSLSVGDRIAIAGETDVINVPTNFQPLLAQKVAAEILESMGDHNAAKMAEQKYQQKEQKAKETISNRVIGSPYKAKPRNGFLRRFSRRRYN